MFWEGANVEMDDGCQFSILSGSVFTFLLPNIMAHIDSGVSCRDDEGGAGHSIEPQAQSAVVMEVKWLHFK